VRTTKKSPEAFRTISEVAEQLDVPQHVLRFWETKFSQIKPLKRAGGRRYYRPEDVSLLVGIKTLLYGDGFTIKGVQKVLREQGVRYVIETGRMVGKADRPLPVSHSGKVTTSDEIAPEVVADAPVPSSAIDEPVITDHQRASLEAILEDLLDLKSTLEEARVPVPAAGEKPAAESDDDAPLLKRA